MKKILLLVLFFITEAYSQIIDVDAILKEIEKGNTSQAESMLADYKIKNPLAFEVLFLEALLTQNADDAIKKYLQLYEKYPNNKYSDLILYRIYSYYYAIGLYKNAEKYFKELKEKCPHSSYISKNSINNAKPDERFNSHRFTIQAGAFLNPDNAKKLNEILKKEGYDSEIINKEIGGSVLSIVNCGKFLTKDEADRVLFELENKFNIKGRIVELEN